MKGGMNVAQLRPLLLFWFFAFLVSKITCFVAFCTPPLSPPLPNSDKGPTAFPQCRHVESHSSDFDVFKVLSVKKKEDTHKCARTFCL